MGHKHVRPTTYHYNHNMSRRSKANRSGYPEEPNNTHVLILVSLGLLLLILIFLLYEKCGS